MCPGKTAHRPPSKLGPVTFPVYRVALQRVKCKSESITPAPALSTGDGELQKCRMSTFVCHKNSTREQIDRLYIL